MASLNTRSGALGRRLAHHLLSRVTYNITPTRIDYFSGRTATQAINELFNPNGSPPVYPDGPISADGSIVFADSDYNHLPGYDYSGGDKIRSIGTWRVYESMAATTAKWKIIDYFGSIFSVYNGGLTYNFHFWRLLEQMAFSNIKKLALKITYDHQMLRYLNNNVNVNSSPNENYAREFLELFTILKGPQIGPGNYTTYTEADISQAARILTGIRSNITIQNVDPETGLLAGFNAVGLHDTGNKVFSSSFQNRTIIGRNTVAGITTEVADFIDMIFDEIATAASYVRKMYYFFVNDHISQEVEDDIILPLATQLQNNGYDHVAVMKVLFRSVHFYDEDDSTSTDEIISAKIKSPLELVQTTKNLLEAASLRDPNDPNYYNELFINDYNRILVHHFSLSGMDPRGPISVEGFSGWNDEARSRLWFTNNYIYNRFTTGVSFKRGMVRYSNNANLVFPYKIDMVAWVENNIDVAGGPGTASAPIGAADSDYLINKMLGYLLVEMPVGDRLCYFQKHLLGGLSAVNWYTVWSDYLTTGVDTEVRIGIERLYDAIMFSPEFQTF